MQENLLILTKMKIERRKPKTAEVYTASLNDIMFFLLLFFLIISTMVAPAAIKVLLPKSETAEQVATKTNITLIMDAEHQFMLDNKMVTFEEIEPNLSAILANNKAQDGSDIEYTVLLQADRSLSIQDVVKVIDIGNRLNVAMVLFTEKE